MAVQSKMLASGQLSLFNTTTQQMLIVEAGSVAQVKAAPDGDAAWQLAQGLVASGQAHQLSKPQLTSVHQATSFLVMLTGSNEWPP